MNSKASVFFFMAFKLRAFIASVSVHSITYLGNDAYQGVLDVSLVLIHNVSKTA